MKVGIFGTGAYGMALASVLTDNNIDVMMWTKFEEEKELLTQNRANEKLLPGYILPDNIQITTNIEECVCDRELLIIAIPAAFVSDLCIELKNYITKDQHICITSKGIEQESGLFIHDIVRNHLNTDCIAVISGPSFAKDVITKNPIGLTLATKNKTTEKIILDALSNQYLKLRSTEDVVGTEICGSIKNVIALAAGIIKGLGANDSTRAMLITESLHDIEEIIEAFSGDKRTVLSFAGFGDLLLTCTSIDSRNYRFGMLIGEGIDLEERKQYLEHTTVEGYYTLESIYQLLKDKKVSIPTIDLIYEIVHKEENPIKLFEFLVYKD